ncbi:MAG: sugar-binding protein, partial [Chloroflexi bacterium]|nr:sugar-binding protein [Chloroflexota bacterium]
IRDALTLARDVEVALVNLNSLDARKSSLTDAGYLTRSEYSEITEAGAVGSVCAVHYDHNGQMLDSPLTHRLIGVTAETLQSIPLTLSVVGGQDKAQAVLGAIRGGLINCLVTDDETARTLVDHA